MTRETTASYSVRAAGLVFATDRASDRRGTMNPDRALDQIRVCLKYRAVEKAQLQRMCAELRIPSDFDIAQISWRPDYDRFFYDQLSPRAPRVYLFRGEYIFDLEKAVVVETPQLGHATYVFANPRSVEGFLVLYTKTVKDDIRRNRDNVG